jgi:hypothetical protein
MNSRLNAVNEEKRPFLPYEGGMTYGDRKRHAVGAFDNVIYY